VGEGDPNPGIKAKVSVLEVGSNFVKFSATPELLAYIEEYGSAYHLKISPDSGDSE